MNEIKFDLTLKKKKIKFYVSFMFLFTINRGSYMSAHVILNLLNELGKKDKMRGFAEHLIGFPQRV